MYTCASDCVAASCAWIARRTAIDAMPPRRRVQTESTPQIVCVRTWMCVHTCLFALVRACERVCLYGSRVVGAGAHGREVGRLCGWAGGCAGVRVGGQAGGAVGNCVCLGLGARVRAGVRVGAWARLCILPCARSLVEAVWGVSSASSLRRSARSTTAGRRQTRSGWRTSATR